MECYETETICHNCASKVDRSNMIIEHEEIDYVLDAISDIYNKIERLKSEYHYNDLY